MEPGVYAGKAFREGNIFTQAASRITNYEIRMTNQSRITNNQMTNAAAGSKLTIRAHPDQFKSLVRPTVRTTRRSVRQSSLKVEK